jgi:hypothetical protein
LEEKLAKVEEDAAANSVAAEKRYRAYCAMVRKDVASLYESYEVAVNGIGGLCSPIDGTSSSLEDYLRWFKSEVDSLPAVFVSANENFVSISLEGVLRMVKHSMRLPLPAGRLFSCLFLVK